MARHVFRIPAFVQRQDSIYRHYDRRRAAICRTQSGDGEPLHKRAGRLEDPLHRSVQKPKLGFKAGSGDKKDEASGETSAYFVATPEPATKPVVQQSWRLYPPDGLSMSRISPTR